MLRLSLALSIFSVLLVSAAVHGQSLAKPTPAIYNRNTSVNERAIDALRRLDQAVIVYRSLGDFDENQKLARVSLRAFEKNLLEVNAELQPLLDQMPASRLKTTLANALDSYRDGAFRWRQIDQPRVIDISALTLSNHTQTSADTAFTGTIPYTVAIHWRQAHRYLKQAENILAAG